jgi:FMN phosphatase YigB (HAD superfamily)
MKYKIIVFDYDGVIVPMGDVSHSFRQEWNERFLRLFNKCKEYGCIFGFITAGNHKNRYDDPSHFYPDGFIESIENHCWYSKKELCRDFEFSFTDPYYYAVAVPFLKSRAMINIHKHFLHISEEEILFVDDSFSNIFEIKKYFPTFHFSGIESFYFLEKEIFE